MTVQMGTGAMIGAGGDASYRQPRSLSVCQPFHQANGRAWRNAVLRAGLENFRFHDLRHTWATRHIQAGTPLHALMELGGWRDAAMVRKYAHFSAAHLQDFAENTVRRENHGTNPSQRKTVNP